MGYVRGIRIFLLKSQSLYTCKVNINKAPDNKTHEPKLNIGMILDVTQTKLCQQQDIKPGPTDNFSTRSGHEILEC